MMQLSPYTNSYYCCCRRCIGNISSCLSRSLPIYVSCYNFSLTSLVLNAADIFLFVSSVYFVLLFIFSIEPAGRTAKEQSIAQNDNSWDSWNMFSLSKTYKDKGQQQHNTPYFFLPPTVDNPISGPPLEEIKFLRDETANLTWAVEKQFRTLYGE